MAADTAFKRSSAPDISLPWRRPPIPTGVNDFNARAGFLRYYAGLRFAGFVLEVDWDDDGQFSQAYDDIGDLTMSIECRRGREDASQLVARAATGQLQALLRNTSGRFSSFYTASPIYGKILPSRKVRFRMAAPYGAVLWTGFLDRIEPQTATADGIPMVMLYASGPFRQISNNKVSPPAQFGGTTGVVIGALLDEAGWPAGDRTIDAGQHEMGRWYIEDRDAIPALQEIEDTEVGFLYEGLAWDFIFEARYNRILNHLVSEATFSDNAGAALSYRNVSQSDPLREIFNEMVIQVQPYHLGASAVLWTLTGETPIIAPAGGSRTYIAQYPNVSSGGAQGAYVSSWTTPVVGTDITQTGVANGDLAVTVSKTATKMFITITNNHATLGAQITLLQARGIPVVKDNPYQVISEDTTSQGKYDVRSYPYTAPWFLNEAYAKSASDYFISRQKDPRPVLAIEIASNKALAYYNQAASRKISSRVTLVANQSRTMLGINGDFYIESIAHRLSAHEGFRTFFELSQAEADPAYWQLDVDLLGVGTKLAY